MKKWHPKPGWSKGAYLPPPSLLPADPEYKCVMIPPKPTTLHSQTYFLLTEKETAVLWKKFLVEQFVKYYKARYREYLKKSKKKKA